MKKVWRQSEKSLYIPKKKPEIIEVPEFKFFTITGYGNPNNEEFSKKVETLYALSYTIKMFPRKGVSILDYFDYTVYPLEGIWDVSDKVKESGVFSKDELVYKIMIRQPDFITDETANLAIESVKNKKSELDLSLVKFEIIKDGRCVQMLHEGSFDEEEKTFNIMKEFISENNINRIDLTHREIYLSDPRKTEKSKLKTTLRYFIK